MVLWARYIAISTRPSTRPSYATLTLAYQINNNNVNFISVPTRAYLIWVCLDQPNFSHPPLRLQASSLECLLWGCAIRKYGGLLRWLFTPTNLSDPKLSSSHEPVSQSYLNPAALLQSQRKLFSYPDVRTTTKRDMCSNNTHLTMSSYIAATDQLTKSHL